MMMDSMKGQQSQLGGHTAGGKDMVLMGQADKVLFQLYID